MIKDCTGAREELGEQGRTLRTAADLTACSVGKRVSSLTGTVWQNVGKVEVFITSSSLLSPASRQRNSLIQKFFSSSSFSRSLDQRETIVCGFA